MPLLFSSLIKSLTRFSYSKRSIKYLNFLIKTDHGNTRYYASLENQFKYFNISNSNTEVCISALMSQHRENKYSHDIMEIRPNFSVISFPKLKDNLFDVGEDMDIDTLFFNTNLGDISCDQLLNIFKFASVDAATKELKPITHMKYDALCEALSYRAEQFSDEQLSSALLYLSLWPMAATAKDKNFYKVWKTFDGLCVARMRQWSFDKLLYFVDSWYLLKLTRISDYVFHSINVMNKKINQLTPHQIVQVLFYLNTIRSAHKGLSMYNIEHKLECNIDKLSLEEIGIAALGFFKTQTSVKSEDLVKHLIDRTITEIDNVPEITLSSILKCLRLSMQINVWNKLPKLLDAITPHLDRFSLQCLAHVALLTAPSQILHPPSLDVVSQRLVDDIKVSRLKDMEKVLFPLSRLDYDPKTEKNVYATVVDELRQPSRQEEIDTFPRCFLALLHCLSVRAIFPHDLVSKALDMNFIYKAYGPRRYNYGRELAFIDTCIELECKDYTGSRLPAELRSYLYSRYAHYSPNEYYKMSKHGRLATDVLHTAQSLLGKKAAKFLYTVPSHPRLDIVLRPGGLPDDFLSIPDYVNPVPSPSGPETTCLVIVSKNMTCPNVDVRLNGETVSKLRSIKILGYTPKLVFYNSWPINEDLLTKEQFLEKILSS